MAGRVRRGDCGVLWRWGQQWRHFIQVSGKAVHSITDGRAHNTMRMPSERYRSTMNCRNASADHMLARRAAAAFVRAAATSARTTRALAQQTDPWP